MSIEPLHQMAQADTPSIVEVPKNWHSFLMWVITRWGVGAVLAYIMWVAFKEERQINQDLNSRLMLMMEQNIRVQSEVAITLKSVQDFMLRLERNKQQTLNQ